MPASRHSVTELHNTQGGKSLYLHTTETDSIAAPDTARIATRGAIVTTDNFATEYGGFGVLAYAYQGEWSETQAPNYIDNEKATASGGTYGFNPPYFWPGEAYKMAFFAYAPYDEDGIIFQEKIGAPTLTYTVPEDITKQKDLLAYWETGISGAKNEKADTLNFSHLCTAVKFKVGSGLENAITSISIKNVYDSGTYSVANDKWTTTGNPDGTYTLTIQSENTPEGTELTEGKNTFMMIPQTLPQNAAIEVIYKDENDQPQTLTANIGGKEWLKGHTVIYKVSREQIEYEFEVTYTDSKYAGKGDKGTFQILSHRGNKATAWDAQFSTDGGSTWTNERPAWLPDFPVAGQGNASTESHSFRITSQIGFIQNEHNTELRKVSPVTGIYDLSTNGSTTSVNTANCYVINAPGTYQFPLVYGNGIKNGNTNTEAYTSTQSSSDRDQPILNAFLDYQNKAITSPYIYQTYAPQDAVLLWQDGQELLQNIHLNEQKQNIVFDVPKENIQQGNAVIAVRDNEGEIIWSWHIWVTYHHLGTGDVDIVNHLNDTYTCMPVNIGWREGGPKIYGPERSVKIKFTQTESGQTQIIELTQEQGSGEKEAHDFSAGYEWGRKDPFRREQDGEYFPTGDAYQLKVVSDYFKGIGESIKYPYQYVDVSESSDWVTQIYVNLWSSTLSEPDEAETNATKTIYDPSPVGYVLPPYNAFTGFVEGDLMDLCEVYKDWDRVNTPDESYQKDKGITFYGADKSQTLFFPVPYNGWFSYWLSSKHDEGGGNAMMVSNNNYLYPRNFERTNYEVIIAFSSYLRSVRPVKEKIN